MLSHQRLTHILAFLLVAACSSTNGADPGSSSSGGGADGGASSAEISRCKTSCDKMKFFDCNSADEQARCYADCDAATASQIQLFTGCAENSICDPACRTRIQPAANPSSGGGGATPSSCSTACDKLVQCSFIPVGAKDKCASECASKGYQYQIDCVNKNACDKIKSACGGGGGGGGDISADGGITVGGDPVADCRTECDQLNFFKCIPVTSFSACRDRCASATSSARDTFTSCSRSSGVDCGRKSGCLDAFLK